jgi:hypothetical protein
MQIEPRDLPEAHDTESVYGECEGKPLGEPGLLSKQPEVKKSGQDERNDGGSRGSDESEYWNR